MIQYVKSVQPHTTGTEDEDDNEYERYKFEFDSDEEYKWEEYDQDQVGLDDYIQAVDAGEDERADGRYLPEEAGGRDGQETAVHEWEEAVGNSGHDVQHDMEDHFDYGGQDYNNDYDEGAGYSDGGYSDGGDSYGSYGGNDTD